MATFNEMEDEEILYYVYKLNWLLPREEQEIAIQFLIKIPPNKIHMIIPKYGKECWENSVFVLKKIGYPRNEKALPKLARLLQDRNWPGSLDAIEIFRELGTAIAIPFIEKECLEAIRLNDLDWLEHLYYACESLNYKQNDFENEEIYSFMKISAESI